MQWDYQTQLEEHLFRRQTKKSIYLFSRYFVVHRAGFEPAEPIGSSNFKSDVYAFPPPMHSANIQINILKQKYYDVKLMLNYKINSIISKKIITFAQTNKTKEI